MCGIVGYIGPRQAVPIILDGLKRLEYRGYDSAGIAVLEAGNCLGVRRASGKLRNLEDALQLNPLDGLYGIGHTRWATHGRPTEENAHPHRDCHGDIVVVHNGIVENYLALKQQLIDEGHNFVTETDTEVIAHLVEKYFDGNLENAVRDAVRQLTGVFALSVISRKDPNKIVAARSGPPVVVGLGDGEYFVASDVPGDSEPHARHVLSGRRRHGHADPRRRASHRFQRTPGQAPGLAHSVGSRSWRKRAATSTSCSRKSLSSRAPCATPRWAAWARKRAAFSWTRWISRRKEFKEFHQVRIVACGTSWHAALAGKFMIERLARIPVEVDYGSEFRYRDPIVGQDTLTVVISQSGETADTLAAQREAKQKGSKTLAICNVVGSMITREAAGTLITHAGPEIGVASTKAFTCQLTALFLLAMYLGQVRETLSTKPRRTAGGRAAAPARPAGRDSAARCDLRGSGQGAVPRRRISCTWAAASTSRSRSKAR